MTYKRKILLNRQEDNPTIASKNNWTFFEKVNGNENTIMRMVEKETSIILPSVKLLLSVFDSFVKKDFYHAELTDKDVNQLVRPEGRELQFFSMREVDLLSLDMLSKNLFQHCRSKIETSFAV
ncbi:MAG: hypothetical protein HY430_02800 [Candidatus Levybacteria bacterium]|nr:hypothetical protein [Candidatus Levybacteria bacterium]